MITYGYVDTADESTRENFNATAFDGDPQKVLDFYGKAKTLVVDNSNKVIVSEDLYPYQINN